MSKSTNQEFAKLYEMAREMEDDEVADLVVAALAGNRDATILCLECLELIKDLNG